MALGKTTVVAEVVNRWQSMLVCSSKRVLNNEWAHGRKIAVGLVTSRMSESRFRVVYVLQLLGPFL